MKKIIFAVISSVLVLSLCSCGAATKDAFSSEYEYFPAESPEYYYDNSYYDEGSYSEEAFDSASSVNVTENAAATNRKLIRTFNLNVETLKFDEFINTITEKVTALGGYVESSSISGNGYSYKGNRYANFTLRVPEGKVDDFINTVDGEANITYKDEKQEDITLTYVDTEARIKTLSTEYDRLIELLGEASDINTIIALESRLSEVRYQLESYQSQLRTFDNKVNYSTVYLDVSEVEWITETQPQTVWERIENEFGTNVYNVWNDLQDFFVWFVTNIPYFAVIAVVIVVIVLIIKGILNLFPGYREKKKQRKILKAERKAQKKLEKERKAAEKGKENVAPTDMKEENNFFEEVKSESTEENTEKTE